MRSTRLLPLLLCLFVSTLGLGQSSLSGSVRDTGGDPVIGAVVNLTGPDGERNILTDADGNFEITDLQDEAYQLVVYATGLRAAPRSVNPARQQTPLSIVVEVDEVLLQEVEVVGRARRDYQSDYSFSATKTAILNKDLPQALTSVTKELLTDRQAYVLQDAVKTVSGVVPTSFYNHFAIRGITQNEEGQIINGMRTRSYYHLQPLTAHVERVEVLKGPAAVTFSSTDPGGSINIVTKKPLAVDRREVSLTAGSFSTLRAALDFTGPLNDDKTLRYRLNAAYQEAGSFRDLIRNQSLLLTPSLSYVPNERTAINTELIFSDLNGYLDRGQPIFGAVAGEVDLASTPISRNLGASNDHLRAKEFIWTTNLTHRISPILSFNATYMKQTWNEDLVEHRTTNAFATDIAGNEVPSLVQMRYIDRRQYWDTDNLTAYLNANLTLGPTEHNVLAGYDAQHWDKLRGSGQNQARGFILQDGTATTSFDPERAGDYQTVTINGATLPRPNVPYYDLSQPDESLRVPDDYAINSRYAIPAATTSTDAVYLQDQIKYGRFSLLLSLRMEWFRDVTNVDAANESSFGNTALIPRLGLTYAASDHINLYATYLEGYQPQSNTVTLMPSTAGFFWADQSAAQFDPLISDLKEVGLKANLLNNRFTWTASAYEINQENILMSANDPDNPDRLTQRGAERSRGVETDVAGYLTTDWQVVASYSYTDARIVNDAEAALVGARKENTPIHSGSLWTRYSLRPKPQGASFGIGLGLNANGSRIPWFSRAFEVPGYTVFDAALYYTAPNGKARIALNVNNLFDTTYWLGAQNLTRLFPGTPRNLLITTTYRF